jgi:3-methyladenine DNA glycosylase AlkD
MAVQETREALLESLLERIRAFCRANADEKVVAKYAKYFKEGYDAYGVDGKLSAEEAKRIYKDYRDTLGPEGFIDLCDLLMENGKYEEAGFAIRFMNLFKKEFSRSTFDRIGNWFEGKVRNWAISDSTCGDLLSPMLAKSIVRLEDFGPWRESSDRWKRRAVPVSMLVLLKSPFDPNELLDFIRPMMSEKERVVHQGLGWFLREIWKKSPAETEAFLSEWKDSAARLIFQYATEKMTPEQKANFRKSK